MKTYSRVCARIDLDAIEYNMDRMKENLKGDAKMIAVVKTDGYGHGAVQIAKLLEEKEYVWGFATATLDEAMVLRRARVRRPILVLGVVFPEQYDDLIEYEIRMTCYDSDTIRAVSEKTRSLGKKAYVHMKLDTGMSRLGFPVTEQAAEEIVRLSGMEGICVEGMYTHFARADETDKQATKEQFEKFLWMKDRLASMGLRIPLSHCSNSAGIIDIPEAHLDLVRAGISLYGLYPSEEVNKRAVSLRPALSLTSHVAFVKWVDAGTPVSYGGTFVTERKTKIATIPIGYGDGYPRSLSGKGYMLIHGQKAPILGRVCMDQCMVDVTDIREDVKKGDEVILIGSCGSEHLPVEILSALSDRFPYEFVCVLAKRIPREYMRHGEVVQQIDYFV